MGSGQQSYLGDLGDTMRHSYHDEALPGKQGFEETGCVISIRLEAHGSQTIGLLFIATSPLPAFVSVGLLTLTLINRTEPRTTSHSFGLHGSHTGTNPDHSIDNSCPPEHGNTITTTFYKVVLKETPSLHDIFNQTNQENNRQAQVLAGALLAYASHINDLGALGPAVEKICNKHASLYIQPEHYNVVAEGLLRVMGMVLGDALTPDILEAGAAAYWQLANVFIEKKAQLYAESKGWTDWRDFTIAQKIKEKFLPGQYISLLVDVPHSGYQQSRQYSLSDAPNPDYCRISVKRESCLDTTHPGWISNILHSEKKVGDFVKLSHPAGAFFFDTAKDIDGPVVLLSAGVGLNPMISILNALLRRGSQQQISFIHGARNTSLPTFADHIREQAERH